MYLLSNNYGCKFSLDALYIINPNYILYQDCHLRKTVHPDRLSFRTLTSQYAKEFAFDRNGIYYKGKLIAVDTSGFKVVGEADSHKFWKNKAFVFDNDFVLTGADPATFEAVECYNIPYFKDKNSVYYLNKKIKGSDPASVSFTCSGPFYDKNHIYSADSLLTYHGKILKSVNQAFGKTDSEVVYLRTNKPVKGIDAKSLIGLSLSYSADRYHVFFDSIAFATPPPDRSNFRVWDQVNSRYYSDDRHVYDGNILCADDVDAVTFSLLPHSDICYDKNGIYYKGWDEKAKKPNFKRYPFAYNVAVTAQNIFLSRNYRFIIYSDQVYDRSDNKVITGLSKSDLKKTKSMSYNFWKLSLLELLHNNINFLENGLRKEGNRLFYQDSLIRAIKAGFLSYLGNSYYSYKKHLYFFNRGLFQAFNGDVTTFKTTAALTYDKDYVYIGTKAILKSKNIQLVAVLAGPMIGGDEGFYYKNYSLYKNYKGYWIKPVDEPQASYVGKSLSLQIATILSQKESNKIKK